MKRYIQTHKWQLGLAALLIFVTAFNLVPPDVAAGGSLVMFAGSSTITQAFVQQWDTTIRLQAQQKESRFENTIFDKGNITGESFTANRLAALEDTPQNTVRHGDTTWSEANHTTRVALMADFYQALPVDRNDEPKLLANPNGAYMQALIAAYNRRKDRIIYNALIGNSQAKDGTLIVLPAGQKIAAGGTAFTKTKLLQTRALFRQNEADEHNGEELYIAYNSKMLQSILADTTLTSADWMAVKMLQDGDVSGKWMGFQWVPYEGLLVTGGTTYTTVAWTKNSCQRGTGYVEGKASRRPDKKDLMQTSMAGSFGAVRVEEEKVTTIDFI